MVMFTTYTYISNTKRFLSGLKGSSGEKDIIFVIIAHKICRLVAFLLLFLDYHFPQDRLSSVLKQRPQVQGFDATQVQKHAEVVQEYAEAVQEYAEVVQEYDEVNTLGVVFLHPFCMFLHHLCVFLHRLCVFLHLGCVKSLHPGALFQNTWQPVLSKGIVQEKK